MAYALLTGADGWMFDGEDALGQINTMSLDNLCNLKLAYRKNLIFLDVAEKMADSLCFRVPGDFFGNDDILYFMEDMATGEIRLSILWEWIHKGAAFTKNDHEKSKTTTLPIVYEMAKKYMIIPNVQLLNQGVSCSFPGTP